MEYDATGGGFVALWLVFASVGENEAGTLKREATPAATTATTPTSMAEGTST